MGIGVAAQQQRLIDEHRAVPHRRRAAQPRQRHPRHQRLDEEQQEAPRQDHHRSPGVAGTPEHALEEEVAEEGRVAEEHHREVFGRGRCGPRREVEGPHQGLDSEHSGYGDREPEQEGEDPAADHDRASALGIPRADRPRHEGQDADGHGLGQGEEGPAREHRGQDACQGLGAEEPDEVGVGVVEADLEQVARVDRERQAEQGPIDRAAQDARGVGLGRRRTQEGLGARGVGGALELGPQIPEGSAKSSVLAARRGRLEPSPQGASTLATSSQ